MKTPPYFTFHTEYPVLCENTLYYRNKMGCTCQFTLIFSDIWHIFTVTFICFVFTSCVFSLSIRPPHLWPLSLFRLVWKGRNTLTCSSELSTGRLDLLQTRRTSLLCSGRQPGQEDRMEDLDGKRQTMKDWENFLFWEQSQDFILLPAQNCEVNKTHIKQ